MPGTSIPQRKGMGVQAWLRASKRRVETFIVVTQQFYLFTCVFTCVLLCDNYLFVLIVLNYNSTWTICLLYSLSIDSCPSENSTQLNFKSMALFSRRREILCISSNQRWNSSRTKHQLRSANIWNRWATDAAMGFSVLFYWGSKRQ